MKELINCPFCSENPVTQVRVTGMGGGEDTVDFSILCPECGCNRTIRLKIHGTCTFDEAEEAMAKAIAVWNRRF